MKKLLLTLICASLTSAWALDFANVGTNIPSVKFSGQPEIDVTTTPANISTTTTGQSISMLFTLKNGYPGITKQVITLSFSKPNQFITNNGSPATCTIPNEEFTCTISLTVSKTAASGPYTIDVTNQGQAIVNKTQIHGNIESESN